MSSFLCKVFSIRLKEQASQSGKKVSQVSKCATIRDDIYKKKIFFKRALPVKLRPPTPRLNGQGSPFSGRQKRHFSAYCRIKFKLIMIRIMRIAMMIMVIIWMIIVMKFTKHHTMGHYYFVKKRIKTTWQGSTPSSPKQAMLV